VCCRDKLPWRRAGSSVVEQGTFNPRVEGSIPSRLTRIAVCASKKRAKITFAQATICPHRLEAQDTALSRRRHGFESRWGHGGGDPVRSGAISSGVEHLPYKEGAAGSNPASPTWKKRHFAGKTPHEGEVRDTLPGPPTATVLQPVSLLGHFRGLWWRGPACRGGRESRCRG
jgi:hypothetical protein